jgi:hypothetical protein
LSIFLFGKRGTQGFEFRIDHEHERVLVIGIYSARARAAHQCKDVKMGKKYP